MGRCERGQVCVGNAAMRHLPPQEHPHLDDAEWGELQHGEGAGRQVRHEALGNGVEVGEQLRLVGSLLDEAVEGDEGRKGLQGSRKSSEHLH